MKKKQALKLTLIVGVGLVAMGLFVCLNRVELKKKVVEWRNERIRNAYFDTLTEKDIAWG